MTESTETTENLPDVLTSAVSAIRDRHHHQQQQQHHQIYTNNENNNGTFYYNNNRAQIKWRNLISFWILGLCNNYGYVVMLSAARDIIKRFDSYSINTVGSLLTYTASRDCNIMSTGVLLLADTIPSMTVKLLAPFLPFYINVRMTLVCLLSSMGFILVATAQNEWQAMLGIIFTSFSSGLGETSLLAYSPKFNKNVISTWSSGTGAAGVGGALTYAGLISIGFTPKSTLLLMLFVPLIQAISFFVVLKEPNTTSPTISNASSTTSLIDHEEEITNASAIPQTPLSLSQKIQYAPKLMKYVLPLFTVYVCEYFINQGLYELIFFPHIWLDHDAQYRWLQVDYQIGVFISRSSVNFFAIKHVWFMSILQFLNVIYFSYEAVYLSTPSIWVVLLFAFWEGLLGGCCYVNTFNRIVREVPQQYKSFSMGFAAIGESIGVVAAGMLAIPIHNVICALPLHHMYY